MNNSLIGLLGFNIEVATLVIVIIGACAVGGGFCWGIIYLYQKNKKQKAKETAQTIVENAKIEAKTIIKEARLSAQEEALKLKTKAENELHDRRAEIEKLNNAFIQREEFINTREQNLEKKNETLENMKAKLEDSEKRLNEQQKQLNDKLTAAQAELQKIAGLSKEQAKEMLIEQITNEAKYDASVKLKEIEQEYRDNEQKLATEIITNAIQKYSADLTSEATVTTIDLPNDEMKGRLIGREGRNIKALESATGIDIIIDDTPEAIVLSGFDPIRREVARIAITKLIQDGRIQPARIEETVAKTRKDIEHEIKDAGENAVLETGIMGLHPELVKVLGRLKYRTSYGQNVLKHSIEVSFIAGMLAAELGCDELVAKRGGLLHDIGKAMDHEVEGTHVSIGVQLAKKYKENEKVINCIEAHHGDVEFSCPEAVLVQAADVISSARPGARRESIENYVKRLEKLETIATSFDGVEKAYAIQAGREVRIIVKPEDIDDGGAIVLVRDIAKKIEAEMEYPGQIKVSVIRETRSVDYAK